jgi:hypothetical protein
VVATSGTLAAIGGVASVGTTTPHAHLIGESGDQLGLKSTPALLARTHKTAAAVFLDGQHAEDLTTDDYPGHH